MNLPWKTDPLGDFANAAQIPEDEGMCMFCFGEKKVPYPWPQICPVCHGTGRQKTPDVKMFKLGLLE